LHHCNVGDWCRKRRRRAWTPADRPGMCSPPYDPLGVSYWPRSGAANHDGCLPPVDPPTYRFGRGRQDSRRTGTPMALRAATLIPRGRSTHFIGGGGFARRRIQRRHDVAVESGRSGLIVKTALFQIEDR